MPKKIDSEKLIEKNLVSGVKKLGGLAIKFSSSYDTGFPDRLIVMPEGKTYWRELKTTGKKPTKLQSLKIEYLRNLGHDVGVIDSLEQLDAFLEELQK